MKISLEIEGNGLKFFFKSIYYKMRMYVRIMRFVVGSYITPFKKIEPNEVAFLMRRYLLRNKKRIMQLAGLGENKSLFHATHDVPEEIVNKVFKEITDHPGRPRKTY